MVVTNIPLGSLIDKVQKIKHTKFNYHEKYLYEVIGLLDIGDECVMREMLTKIIAALKSGFTKMRLETK